MNIVGSMTYVDILIEVEKTIFFIMGTYLYKFTPFIHSIQTTCQLTS